MEFTPVPRGTIDVFEPYAAALSGPIESFVEGHLLASDAFRIAIDGVSAGSFAVENGTLLTNFHMSGAARRHARRALAAIFEAHPITTALVPTCDEFMLCQLLDREHVLHLQAYFFGEAVPGTADSAPPAALSYRPAVASDVAAIEAVSGDFLDRLPERVAAGEVHVGHDESSESRRSGGSGGSGGSGELVAVGIAEPGRLLTDYASIGMFTAASRRRSGIGTATLRYLRNRCHAHGVTPIAGCWYGNHASRHTLEAAGMVTTARLLRFEFPMPSADSNSHHIGGTRHDGTDSDGTESDGTDSDGTEGEDAGSEE